MLAPRTGFSALIVTVLFIAGLNTARAQQLVPASGRVIYESTPLCALVLINGQSEFSCGGDGRFDLNVPLDANGMVTVQVFASGFAPSNRILPPEDVSGLLVEMFRVSNGRTFEVNSTCSSTGQAGRAFISGTVQAGSASVCALILANGQKMFSCEANLGQFALDVPLDNDGNVELQIFADGFSPYTKALRGCAPSGNPNNLTAVSLENESSDPRIGYPLGLILTIEAIEAVRDVGVTFYAFDKADPDARQFSLGARTIEVLDTGSNAVEIELDVPTDIEISGEYYIGASVDPADVITETNEEDNRASTEVTFAATQLPNLFIEFMEPDRSAIVLDRTAWDYEEQISENGEIVSDAGGTVTYGAQGTEGPIDVEAFASLRMMRSGGGQSGPIGPLSITRTGDTLDVPLYLWDSIAERYIHAYGIDPDQGSNTGVEEWLSIGRVGSKNTTGSSEFDSKSAHLDYYFPGRLAQEIEIALRKLNVFLGPIVPPPDLSSADIQTLRSFLSGAELADISSELCLSIRPSDSSIVEDRVDDNSICSPLQLLLPPVDTQGPPPPPIPVPPIYDIPTNPIFYSAQYIAGWPGEYFGASINFSAYTSADSNGVVAGAKTELPVTVFRRTYQLLGIEARAQVLPLSDRFASPEKKAQLDEGFLLTVSTLNQILFVRDDPPEGSLGELEVSWSVAYPKWDSAPDPEFVDCPPPAPGRCPKPPEVDVVNPKPPIRPFVYLGPVKVEFEAGVSGTIGVEAEVEFGSPSLEGLTYSIAPFASAEVYGKAFTSLIVGQLGVEITAVLIKVAQPHESIFTINVIDDRHFDGTSEVVVTNQFLVQNTIEGLSGRFDAYAELGGGESCNWGFFNFICKALPTFRYSLNLFNWEPFLKDEVTLKDERETITILTLPDGGVSYFKEQ
jgi:hypothetical protein